MEWRKLDPISTTMERRKLLRRAGGIGVIAALGGGALVGLSGNIAAASGSISANDVTESNDTGDVDRVYIQPEGQVTWANFDQDVQEIRLEVFYGLMESGSLNPNDSSQVDGSYSTTVTPDSTGTTGNWTGSAPEIDLYGGNSSVSDAEFDHGSDGSSESNRVALAYRITLLNSNGSRVDPEQKASFTINTAFRATTVNQGAETGASGNSNTGME